MFSPRLRIIFVTYVPVGCCRGRLCLFWRNIKYLLEDTTSRGDTIRDPASLILNILRLSKTTVTEGLTLTPSFGDFRWGISKSKHSFAYLFQEPYYQGSIHHIISVFNTFTGCAVCMCLVMCVLCNWLLLSEGQTPCVSI